MSVAQGAKAFLQLKKETTYGSAIVVTGTRSELISCDIGPNLASIPDPSLYQGASPRAILQGGYTFRGRFVVRVNYEGCIQRFFEGVMGATTDSAALAGGGFDHTLKEAVALPSYTIEVMPGDPTGGGTAIRLLGAKFTSCTVRCTGGTGPDAVIQAEFEVLAKDVASPGFVTPASLSFPAVWPIPFHHATIIDNGLAVFTPPSSGTPLRVRSFECTIQNALADDRWYLGSLTIDEPIRSNFLAARFKFTEEFQDYGLFNAARQFTAASPQLIFQEPTTVLTGGTTTNKREFELRMGSARWSDYSDPVEGYGVVLAQHTMAAFQDPTDASALVVRFRNNDATVAAA